MEKKIVDLSLYRIEKSLKNEGYIIVKDKRKKIKLLLRIKRD